VSWAHDGLDPAKFVRRLESAAREVGRFRRRVQSDPELARFYFLADRLADDVEWLFLLVEPTAAELTASEHPGDAETADAAIEAVDQRGAEIRWLLGDRTAQ
jgi:hypothetical protein